ncbi:MAG: helix-turn-helix domain-containing protein [Firmicutes bacterium]|nr:helix-turn-helix domain-containing protein [Bacillota bacterium]
MPQIIYAGKHLLTFNVSKHAHSSWELIYCTSGSGVLRLENESLPYKSHDLLIIPPFYPHQNESADGFTNIHLNLHSSLLMMDKPCLIHDDPGHFIQDAFQAVFYHFSQAPGSQTPLLGAYANLIVHQILDKLNAPSLSPVVQEITNTIISSYPNEGFELDSYLHSLPFSYDYLRKLFRKERGITPHQLLMNTRLQSAAERLSSDESKTVSISEVCHLCGFHDPLYFSRVFSRKYGISPLHYQEQKQNEKPKAMDSESIKIPL